MIAIQYRYLAYVIVLMMTSLSYGKAHDLAALPPCLSVLFVGDSITYVNNMPAIASAIARSQGRCVNASMVASGGESLRDHWQSGDVERALKTASWRYVIFQDQSSFGEVYLVNGQYRVHDATELFTYGHYLFQSVRRCGGSPIVFLPWARRLAPARDVDYTRWAYGKFARDENALLVPAMDAWAIAQRQLPDVNFYLPDGVHPTSAGSYLTAALFVAALVKVNPVGASTTILGPAVDFQSGSVKPGAAVLLADLPQIVGNRLQRIAFDVARRNPEIQLVEPHPINLPTVPRGQTLQSRMLEGRWVGSSLVYPYPATISLEICTRPTLTVNAVVYFGGHPDTLRFSDHHPLLTTKSLTFTDAQGPNGGRVSYTAALDGRALSGIGQILVPHAPIYGIGVWSARRRASSTCTRRGGDV